MTVTEISTANSLLSLLASKLRWAVGTTQGRLLLATIIGATYAISGGGGNPNPLLRVENAPPFVWPDGCSQAAIDQAVAEARGKWGGVPHIPCSCAAAENEIRDWFERGLPSYSYTSRTTPSYFRIGNNAAIITIRPKSSANPLCSYRNFDDRDGSKKFFVVNNTGAK